MKKTSLFLLLAVIMAGCRNTADEVYYDDTYDYDTDVVTVPYVSEIKAIETNGDRDLTVETAHHVIQIEGNPGTQYKYYVWRGNVDAANTDPDVIVDRGAVMVRTGDD